MAIIKSLLTLKIPLFAVLAGALLAMAAIAGNGLRIAKLYGDKAELTQELSAVSRQAHDLAWENAAKALEIHSQAKAIDGLKSQLAASEAACAKQLTDRELIAQIKAGAGCAVKERQMEVAGDETSTQTVYFINSVFGAGVRPQP